MDKLLIVDSSTAFTSAVESVLKDQFQIQCCHDGEAAVEILEEYHPDALIINLMLPYLDGLTVLQKTSFHPNIILAVTPYLNGYIQHTIRELGVDYTMLCPSVNALCLRLQDLQQTKVATPSAADPAQIIAHHLDLMHFSPHWDGYRQLCCAIPLYAQNPGQFMTKELYPAVAKQCDCKSPQCVEHSIRKAIRTAWAKGDLAIWRQYYSPGMRGKVACPSNKEFICRLSELLHSQ